MTRYAIDAPTALRIMREKVMILPSHRLVAPNLLRSQALSLLYREVHTGELDEASGRAQLERLAELRIRLLGDRVSRATAWKIATALGWDDTAPAEYLAVAKLQADALVTEDPRLIAGAQGIIATAPFSALTSA
jgi:predicted nucleic acid-binding protein